MKLKYNLKFRLEQRKDRDSGKIIIENVPIFLDFTFDSKRLVYFIGYRIDFSKWDKDTQRVKRNSFNKEQISANEINNHIADIEKNVVDILKENKALHKNPSAAEIREELKIRLKEPERIEKSFLDYMLEFIEIESKLRDWAAPTKGKFMTVYDHLKEFQTENNYKIEFSRIDDNFFNKYLNYLREDLKFRNTTASKNIKLLKWFLNWATRKGYNKNLCYKEFNPKLKGTEIDQNIIFLTWKELMKLYNLKITKNYLEQVRDVFCFCCLTGLRFSDVKNLKRGNIKKGAIEFTTKKTTDPLIINLNKYSQKILNKYKKVGFKDNKCLPVISNQNFNKYLKELGASAKLNDVQTIVYYRGAERIEETFKKHELLGTKFGRKTFITNAMDMGISSEVIMSWTGHKDHRAMKPYYKILQDKKRKEMKKFNK